MSERHVAGSMGIGALVAAAMYALMPQTASRGAAPATGQIISDAQEPRSVSLLTDFLGKDADGKPRVPESAPYKVRFVIATLPDPVDSHFASGFDRGLEAI